LKTARIFALLALMAASNVALSQSITMHAVLARSREGVKEAADSLKKMKWKTVKTEKIAVEDMQDPNGMYARFTNCFFMLPEYKQKFRMDAGKGGNGLYRNTYSKTGDTIFIYYFSVEKQEFPAGLIYRTNRNKLPKITQYLKHNKYTKTFSRDSIVVYEVRPSIENVTVDKSDAHTIDYYIDRCWKYTGKVKK